MRESEGQGAKVDKRQVRVRNGGKVRVNECPVSPKPTLQPGCLVAWLPSPGVWWSKSGRGRKTKQSLCALPGNDEL